MKSEKEAGTPIAVAPRPVGDRGVATIAASAGRRVELRLGSIEDLFADPPDSKRGRMARLQALGLFFCVPLSRSDAEKVCDAWEKTIRQDVLQVKDVPAMDAQIETALQHWVVGRGATLIHEGKEGPTTIPSVPKKPGDDVTRIRIPGAFRCSREEPDLDADSYAANPVLGKIPLVAKVTPPTPGLTIHFELMEYDNLSWRSERDALQKKLMKERNEVKVRELERQLQSFTLPKFSWEEQVVPGEFLGFHKSHSTRSLSHTPYLPARVEGTSLVTETNEEGEAAILFRPLKFHGTRYRFKASVGAPKPEAPPAASYETEPLVVWRTCHAHSKGSPNSGSLISGLQLPNHPPIQWRKGKFAQCWGTDHMVYALWWIGERMVSLHGQNSTLVVSDISKRGGVDNMGHKSHTSGRDVDICVYICKKNEDGTDGDPVDFVPEDKILSDGRSPKMRNGVAVYLDRQRNLDLVCAILECPYVDLNSGGAKFFYNMEIFGYVEEYWKKQVQGAEGEKRRRLEQLLDRARKTLTNLSDHRNHFHVRTESCPADHADHGCKS